MKFNMIFGVLMLENRVAAGSFRLPFARRLVWSFGGFVYHFKGRFPEISQQNGKYVGKLLIIKGQNRAGSQEVVSSILTSSTITHL
jgi:hypothetical protein